MFVDLMKGIINSAASNGYYQAKQNLRNASTYEEQRIWQEKMDKFEYLRNSSSRSNNRGY